MLFSEDDFTLRPMLLGDIDTVLRWRNLEHIRTNMYTDQIITPEEHRQWFSDVLSKKNAEYFILEYKGNPVGQSNALNIDRVSSKCHWGLYIGEHEVPHGTGTVMGFLTLSYIFEKIGMRKICGEILSFNSGSIRLHRRLGFETEGCLRKHILKKKKYEDVVCMALFQNEWPEIEKRMRKKIFCV